MRAEIRNGSGRETYYDSGLLVCNRKGALVLSSFDLSKWKELVNQV